MKRLLPLLSISLLSTFALASDQLRNVQTELKDQGFYYGDVTGNESTELTAAIRRYQIRNGLEVTGTLTAQTLKSLDIGGAPVAAVPPSKPAPAAPPPEPPRQTVTPRPPSPTAPRPPVNLRKNETVQDNDRRFLDQEPRQRSIIRPPAPLDGDPVDSSGDYVDLFAGTPYATAPQELQEQTLKRAQTLLANRGFYRDAIDGDPGPATEEAILSFQRTSRLPLTGRLDLQTLSQLRLLPGRGAGNPALKPFNAAPDRSPSRQVHREMWVE